MEQASLEKTRAFFAKDRFATENGAQIDEVGDHSAVCSLTVTEHHRNAMGGVMGGVPFMLADFAFAVASNWQKPDTVSLSSTIHFLGTAKGTRLIAKAQCIKDGRSTSYYEIHVEDELGNKIAEVVATGFHVSK